MQGGRWHDKQAMPENAGRDPDEIGALRPGMTMDVSALSDHCGRFVLQDNEKTQVATERLLQPLFCLRAGKRYDADAAIPSRAVAASRAGRGVRSSARGLVDSGL